MRHFLYILFGIFLLVGMSHSCHSQQEFDTISFFEPSPIYHKKRFNTALVASSTIYAGFSYGLYNTWYRQYESESFHFFDDGGEWENIDKLGHLYTAYFQGVLCYKGAKWTGVTENQAIMTGLICGALFQTTIEVMDGFSSKWGFSLTDMAANTLGLASFGLQQKYWGEQRILFKVSSWPKSYENISLVSSDGTTMSDLNTRVEDLFGVNYFENFLKDYNAQTIWASVNVDSFLPEDNNWPNWLNIAVGYSAENMFGGFENEWEIDGKTFRLDSNQDRYKQLIIGTDIDLSRIKVKNHFLKSVLSVFNIFKIPSPAIEINGRGEVHFHFMYL